MKYNLIMTPKFMMMIERKIFQKVMFRLYAAYEVNPDFCY